MARKKSVTDHAKNSANQLLNTVLLLLPAVAGGAVGAGLGRNSLLAGGALLTASNQMNWPAWVQSLAVGMAVNGVATTKPVTEEAKMAASVEGEQLSGMLPFVPDNFMVRADQYLKNIMMNTYLDKVPVVNSFVGLAGLEENNFLPAASANINLNPAARNELNRLMAQRTSGISGLDAQAFKSLAGIDQQQMKNYKVRERDMVRRRRAA